MGPPSFFPNREGLGYKVVHGRPRLLHRVEGLSYLDDTRTRSIRLVDGTCRGVTVPQRDERFRDNATCGYIPFGESMQGPGLTEEVSGSWRVMICPNRGTPTEVDGREPVERGPRTFGPRSGQEPRCIPCIRISTTSGRENSGGGYSLRASISCSRASEIKTWEEGSWGQVLEETMP